MDFIRGGNHNEEGIIISDSNRKRTGSDGEQGVYKVVPEFNLPFDQGELWEK